VNIVFFGTPDFAVPTLKALIATAEHKVLAVVSQPDRPAGRGQNLHVPPTKQLALEHDILVLQPEKLSKSPETVATLKALQPDLIVMVAFGQILKKEVLELPRLGVLNLHGSLLPTYRGAAPINWAIINGEAEAGVTTMFTEAGVDSGPMLLKHSVKISDEMTAPELACELSASGADLVIETIRQLEAGVLPVTRQDDSLATYAPMLTKEQGRLDWQKPAIKLHNLVRGLLPWPGTYTTFKGTQIKICKTSLDKPSGVDADLGSSEYVAGTITIDGKNVFVKCGIGAFEWLKLLEVQTSGKAKTTAFQWANGARLSHDEKFV
jgi:methionyl-tRNA formyltransferase